MPGYVRDRGVAKSGKRMWQARWRHPQDPRIRIEKHWPTKTLASRWIKQMDSDAWEGAYVDPRDSSRPFADAVDSWRTTWLDLEPKTRAGYESILARHLLPAFGERRLAQLEADDVQRYVNKLAVDLAPNTVRRIYTVLRAVLGHAVRRRMLATNPCEGTKLPRKPTRATRVVLTADEVRTLAEGVPEHWRVAVYVAAYTGLRAGELWALQRRDVDLLHGRLHVRRALKEINSKHLAASDKGLIFGPTKTHAERVLGIGGTLRGMLADHLTGVPGGADALVFTTPGGRPVRHNLFYKRVFRPAVAASLPAAKHALRWHDLRHTCATLAVAANAHPLAIKARLGHEDIRTTMNTYGHLYPSAEDALGEALDKELTMAGVSGTSRNFL